jgi:hypothetical protein
VTATRPQGRRWYARQQLLYARALLRHRQLDPREWLVFPDRRLAFGVLSKNACTSIKRALGDRYGICAADIHAAPEWKPHKRWGMLRGDERGYDSFAFVRNPFARLVSCYRDKILWEPGDPIYPRPYFDIAPYRLPTNVPFAEFASRVARIPDRVADRHFKSQSADLYRHGERVVGFVGHMERLDHDWHHIAERHDLPLVLERAHTTRAKGPHADWQAYYDRATVDLVAARYRTDLALLGYEGAREELLAHLR